MSTPNDRRFAGVNVQGIRDYLDDTEVVFAILFGSHARGTASESSDVDVTLRFPEGMDKHDRFHRRNRIDAELQEYAETFVDVSDVEALPLHVAYRALRDGVVIAGDEDAVAEYLQHVETQFESTAARRKREQRKFIDSLASGDV